MLGKLPEPGLLLTWITVVQGPIVLAVGAGGGCLNIFSLIFHFSFLSPSLWETARYRLKYCLKGPLSPKLPTYLHQQFFFHHNKTDMRLYAVLVTFAHYVNNVCSNENSVFIAGTRNWSLIQGQIKTSISTGPVGTSILWVPWSINSKQIANRAVFF